MIEPVILLIRGLGPVRGAVEVLWTKSFSLKSSREIFLLEIGKFSSVNMR
jgi:hypothetical protein